jgi:hypothetical protein
MSVPGPGSLVRGDQLYGVAGPLVQFGCAQVADAEGLAVVAMSHEIPVIPNGADTDAFQPHHLDSPSRL